MRLSDTVTRNLCLLRLGAFGLGAVLFLAQVVGARELTVGQEDLRRIGSGPLMLPDVQGHPRDPDRPVVDPAVTDAAAGLLRRLVARGEAQGFGGILYENRDRGHSILPDTLFPNLTFLKYDEALQQRRLDYGLAGSVFIPNLVFGNSSTAITGGTRPRSLVRHAMTTPGGAARAFRDYSSNSLYLYPEHRDHDNTDLFPANWPYMLTSQGSSGSDQPFMKAVAMTLAAFSAETRAALETAGLIAPTVQMILRRNQTFVRNRADYLSGAAHPPVFSAEHVRPGRMIQQAAALKPDEIPPLVRLRVLSESFELEAGLNGGDEHLFTTPSAIARIWRSPAWQQEMVLSAAATQDPNGRDLSFDWVLLRGDPERVRIEPLDDAGLTARVVVNWHEPYVLQPPRANADPPRTTSRVDIGVFAWNGKTDSAPAILSISFPTHQARTYDSGPDGRLRLSAIDYDAIARNASYDPELHWSAAWTDRYRYASDGTLLGWLRDEDGQITEFDADGMRSDGSPVSYRIMGGDSHRPILVGDVAQSGN